MFDTSQLFGGTAAVGAFYPKTIDQSLRFEDGDSAYLTLALGDKDTPTDVDKCTISVWLKRGNLGSFQTFMFAGTATNNTILQFDTSDRIYFSQEAGGTKRGRVSTSAVFRDPSAWYHIVFAYDSSEAVAADIAKLWVNGVSVEFTNQTDAIDSDRDNFWFSDTYDSHIGYDINATTHKFDGYMAEYHGIDGQALDHTSFGELKSGIWIPKAYAGTYGTNGFYLDGSDITLSGSNITFVNDTSPNSNNFTANNLVASDVVLDSPTNSFCTMNPLNGSRTLSQGNLRTVATSATYRYSTFAIPSSGKWYWEMLHESDYRSSRFGFANAEALGTGSGDFSGIESSSSGNDYRFDDQTLTDITDFMTSGGTGVIAFAVDMDAGEFDVYLDGVLKTSGTFTSTSDKFVYERSGSTYTIVHFYNFGQDSTFAGNKTAGGNSDANGIGDFAYAPPSGYLALCTSNLPDPAIDPAQDATPEDHFNVVTYSGNSSSLSVTGVGFEPDFTWIKNRTSSTDYHTFFDKVRGTNGSYYSFLLCPYTGTEDYAPQGGNGGFGAIETFDTDGFTLDSSNSDWSRTNESGQDYVAYNWSLPTTVSGSTAGVGTPQSYTGRVNADAGVSIIAYSGNNDGGHRIPHHLNEAPEFVICKGRTYLQGWPAYHAYQDIANPEDIYLELNTTDYRNQDDVRFWQDTKPDSTHVTLGTIAWLNGSGYDYVMYSFHSVDGFSKVGQFTGNGSTTDGPFVYTGFRPKWVMIKQVSSAGWGWYIFDSERSQDNVVDDYINTASVAGEVSNSTTADIDFLSNGFKLRGSFQGTNENLMDFSYLAFAEQPFKYSNAR